MSESIIETGAMRLIQEHGKLSTLNLCEMLDTDWETIDSALTNLTNEGMLVRGMLLTPNGDKRPILSLGWSCKTD